MLVHSVLFWLKPGTDKARFRAELLKLAAMPGLVSCYVGTPAATAKRPVIDASYDFALTVVVKDIAAHDAYQAHPLHTAFLAGCKEQWSKVQIYDAE
jgi:hypothetical protein